ncbi:MMS21 DNA repair protein MMS21 [Pyrenophora tritici-repentis]|uniref:Chromosomal organization and dna repair protein n=2 Tax=Pyrenophora tritici-repentis TaxID=45151 RepID=A0A2W1GSK9_9PLEO|nr:uncharacterized protein PTRG_06628 [Pyrenophora tritici-repentis Pt-1C-BFP]KAA8613725.1 chromosomal organization and dna repair protein [Pyrenophora tritici-repentis]EDU49548.1 conserved hypothetical protein [Pyrenophora tritici-repentis Pt-1C-BFP]KAF7445447.1 chromosomal organization and dna repair protein [Pyrenophora tritici-repentis]KAF7565715.1 zf-Nse domain containing protein [Pyrenophora tritici-repentis]KAG9380175.1 chromosomal organization and dna repair protein [Pyrenophora tritic
MSTRNRPGKARPTPSRLSGTANPSPNADVLPPYKKPSHPLDQEASAAIRTLRGRNLEEVKKHNKQAVSAIIESAAGVNDRLREHGEFMERRRPKWDAGKNLEEKEEVEREMQELKSQVEGATVKLEESMRAIIDSGVATERIDETLEWLRTNGPQRLNEEYQTQRTLRRTQRELQSQAASQRQRTQNEDGEDEEMDVGLTPGPTPLDGSRIKLTGASELFQTRMQNQKDAYTSLSLETRYARNNDYREFKKMVHDAKYGDEGPALGHENTWFTETGSPAPGVTDGTHRGDLDDDDDIIMDRATISTRCPITFQNFKDPVTSTKCPHTFEKVAITDMVRRGPHRVGTAPAVECPVSGCSHILTKDDLRSDPIIIRKIKRMQERDEAPDDGENSDDEVQAPVRDVDELDSE